MAKTRKKITEDEKIKKRKEQKKLVMRKLREKLKKNPDKLEEKRKKDREYYYKKKNQGEIKSIKDLSERDQRKLRKKWREDAQKRREIKKIQRRTEEIVEKETPPTSPIHLNTPAPSVSAVLTTPSTSRVSLGKCMAARNRRLLKTENVYLRHKLQALENQLAKYRMRLHRKQVKVDKDRNETSEQNKENQNKEKLKNKRKNNLPTAIKIQQLIENFLTSDENSRLTSGKKETITRYKNKKQIRLLNDVLRNLHIKFYKETGFQVSYKTFCRYRPFWVLTPKVSGRDTCLCALHENVNFVAQSLKNANIIKQNGALEVAKSLCCDEMKETCLERKCSECVNRVVELHQYIENDSINYQRWVTKKVPMQIKGVEKLCQKTVKETVLTSKKALIDIFYSIMPPFMQHLANIYHQTHIVRKIKQEIGPCQGLLHCDFSENYQCKYGSEVQGAHFGGSKSQISLHTSVFYYRSTNDDSPPAHKSFCTVSENLRHDPVLICAHLKPVIETIKAELVRDLKVLHILSDGPSTQYRNKTMFFLMVENLSIQLGVEEIYWHFSESGHGKGAPDGVGGCLKRTADREVALNRDISDMQSLVCCLQDKVPAISVIPIDDTYVAEIEETVKKTEVRPFKGTLKIHQITWHKSDPLVVHARRLSCLVCPASAICEHYEIGHILIKSTKYQKPESDDDDVPYAPPATPVKRIWRYADIYSDSSDDDIPLKNLLPSTSPKVPKATEDPKALRTNFEKSFWFDSDEDENIF